MDFKRHFYGLETLQQVKARYRELAKTYHPDTGGSEDAMKALVAAFEWAIANVYRLAAMQDAQERGYDFDDINIAGMADILKQVIDLDCRLEIIGVWLYAFEAYSVKAKLKELGFWFSSKHKAWIFNRGTKIRRYSRMSTDDIRNKYGCQSINQPKRDARAALAG